MDIIVDPDPEEEEEEGADEFDALWEAVSRIAEKTGVDISDLIPEEDHDNG